MASGKHPPPAKRPRDALEADPAATPRGGSQASSLGGGTSSSPGASPRGSPADAAAGARGARGAGPSTGVDGLPLKPIRRAKYPSNCKLCGFKIQVGELIFPSLAQSPPRGAAEATGGAGAAGALDGGWSHLRCAAARLPAGLGPHLALFAESRPPKSAASTRDWARCPVCSEGFTPGQAVCEAAGLPSWPHLACVLEYNKAVDPLGAAGAAAAETGGTAGGAGRAEPAGAASGAGRGPAPMEVDGEGPAGGYPAAAPPGSELGPVVTTHERLVRWMQEDAGHAFVEARAGCGKTWMLIELARGLPHMQGPGATGGPHAADAGGRSAAGGSGAAAAGARDAPMGRLDAVFVTYNKTAQLELGARLSTNSADVPAISGGEEAYTFHGLGKRAWMRIVSRGLQVTQAKTKFLYKELFPPDRARGPQPAHEMLMGKFVKKLLSLAKSAGVGCRPEPAAGGPAGAAGALGLPTDLPSLSLESLSRVVSEYALHTRFLQSASERNAKQCVPPLAVRLEVGLDRALQVLKLSIVRSYDHVDERGRVMRHGEIDLDDMCFMPLYHAAAGYARHDLGGPAARRIRNPYAAAALGGAGYAWVLVDEAQDLTAARRATVPLLLRRDARGAVTGRAIAVGDRHQSINAFAGAERDAMARLRADLAAAAPAPGHIAAPVTAFLLPDCRRCARAIIAYVHEKTDVKDIRAADGAALGDVHDGRGEGVRFASAGAPAPAAGSAAPDLRLLVEGRSAAVLCRLNTPLVKLAFQLLRRGVLCVILGRDLLSELETLLRTKLKLEADSSSLEEVESALEAHLENERLDATMTGQEEKLEATEDKAECIREVINALRQEARDAAGANGANGEGANGAGDGAGDGAEEPPLRLEALLARLREMLSGVADNQPHVVLSTVHKAKGLEWDRVWILQPEHLTPVWYMTAADKEQLMNLKYVAYTRPRLSLFILPMLEKSQPFAGLFAGAGAGAGAGAEALPAEPGAAQLIAGLRARGGPPPAAACAAAAAGDITPLRDLYIKLLPHAQLLGPVPRPAAGCDSLRNQNLILLQRLGQPLLDTIDLHTGQRLAPSEEAMRQAFKRVVGEMHPDKTAGLPADDRAARAAILMHVLAVRDAGRAAGLRL